MMFIAGIIAVLVIVFVLSKKSASTEVYSRFGVRDSTHTILSTDLGNAKAQMKLTRHGVNGIADAVFEARSRKSILVGEFKSRKYRQQVRLNEFYQIILYMGHLQAKYPDHTIAGCLAYADGKVNVAFDRAVYEGLIGLKDEYWQSLRMKRPVNKTPLHKRMNVRAENRTIRFTSAL
ncbi:hypothetical protein ACI77O_13355 [Pseudomonas tritici]|uniref:hypothetical protein n=1 Tax=Pseudomonas tritici TaxID=2745518 RepID=UPI00387B89FA